MQKRCRIVGVSDSEVFIESHIKLWRDSNNEERFDVENWLLLIPTNERLFDRGFVGFQDYGKLSLAGTKCILG
ncbi:MAG: HNH endonuclease [Phycisphaerales bacterium]|nr:HNH endonuclease [Phycisphaerales bacterium]